MAFSLFDKMPDRYFRRMRAILASPSPSGFEEAMVQTILIQLGTVLPPSWEVVRFGGNAGLVIDTHPGRDDLPTIGVAGHTDKIRLLVRSIDPKDGRIWLGHAESFMPAVVVGSEAKLLCRDPKNRDGFLEIPGTIEAIGAIHFAEPAVRTGEKGIKAEQLYFEPCLVGDKVADQLRQIGVRVGDPVIFDRPIRRMMDPNTFQGAYLDNGLGCFAVAELARLFAKYGRPENVRILFTFTTHEELDRLGARMIVGQYGSVLDAFIGVDVNHDYMAAPGVKDKHHPPLTMGAGFTIGHGSLTNPYLNGLIIECAEAYRIPYQHDSVGRDTGTDTMAVVCGDIAGATIGFPVRNMHTPSECGHTGDVLAAIEVLYLFFNGLSGQKVDKHFLVGNHPNLANSRPATLPVVSVEVPE